MTSVLKTKNVLQNGLTETVAKKRKMTNGVSNGDGDHVSENGANLQNGDKCRYAPKKECGQVDVEDILKRRHTSVG